MGRFTRRSFLQKTGETLAVAAPMAANSAGGVGQARGNANTRDLEDPPRFGIARSVVEWYCASNHSYSDPFNDVELDVVFTDPAGREYKVPAFWAGEQTWRIRFSPPAAGRYSYRSVASDQGDLDGRRGMLEVVPYQGDNPLRRHGPIQVAADQRHFQHADGTPFFWLGDTWWMGLCSRLRWPEDFERWPPIACKRVSR